MLQVAFEEDFKEHLFRFKHFVDDDRNRRVVRYRSISERSVLIGAGQIPTIIVSDLTRVSVMRVAKALVPFYIAFAVSLVLFSLFPFFSTYLPSILRL